MTTLVQIHGVCLTAFSIVSIEERLSRVTLIFHPWSKGWDTENLCVLLQEETRLSLLLNNAGLCFILVVEIFFFFKEEDYYAFFSVLLTPLLVNINKLSIGPVP